MNPTLTINRMDNPTFESAAYVSFVGDAWAGPARPIGFGTPAIRVICQNTGQVQGEWVLKIASMTQLKQGGTDIRLLRPRRRRSAWPKTSSPNSSA